MTAPANSPQPAGRVWLYGPTADLLIGCGAWSLPLLALTFFLQRENAVGLSLGFYLLGVFCNNPHYMATIHRAYRTADDFNKYRFFTVYVTALLAATIVLVHLIPSLFPWVVTLYLTWSPWHYTGQNFGITQMFVRRAGCPPDPAARQLLYGSYVASFAVFFLTLHSVTDGDPNFLSLRLPEEIAVRGQILFSLIFVGCATAAFTRLARRLPLRALAPPMLLTLTQLSWFVGPALLARFGILELPASYFSVGALAFMHCAQYLWITSYYARNDQRRGAGGDTAEGIPRPAFSFWRYYFALVVGGIALFVPGPWVASRLLGHDLVESFLIFMALVNLHHFILDGAIWKLRDGRIARLLLGRRAPEEPDDELRRQSPGLRDHLGWLFGPSRPARLTRFTGAGAVLAIGLIDQAQNLFTQRSGNVDTLARAEILNPGDTRVYYRRAQNALAAGDAAAARRELERIIRINPRNVAAQHLLGEIIFRSGDTPGALTHYDHMAELFRPDLSIAVNRGLLARQQGRPDSAVARFAEALKIAPHKTELHFLLAEALRAAGDTDSALKQYELFTALFEEAVDTPEERERLLPTYVAAGMELGDIYEAAQDLPAAEKRFQRTADMAVAHRRFKEASGSLSRLADVQKKLGRTADAATSYTAALQAAGLAETGR